MKKISNIKDKILSILKSMRIHQWIKNLVIFMPILIQKNFSIETFISTFSIFILFSFTASSIYIFNDIIDYKEDLLHPIKKLRPVTSNKISLVKASIIGLFLLIFPLFYSKTINITFQKIIILYVLLNFCYMSFLKKFFIIDILCIATFLYIRLLSGETVIEKKLDNFISISFFMFFVFMGFSKRYFDLKQYTSEIDKYRSACLKKYKYQNLDLLIKFFAVLIYSLYMIYIFKNIELSHNYKIIGFISLIILSLSGLLHFMRLIRKNSTKDLVSEIILDFKLLIIFIVWIVLNLLVLS